MKKLIIVFILLFVSVSCSQKTNSKAPKPLLSEKEMVAIIADVQIIEAMLNQRKAQERKEGSPLPEYSGITKEYYGQLFEHYGITDSIFVENMKYYTEQPAVMERIMDSVTQRLTREQSTSSTQ